MTVGQSRAAWTLGGILLAGLLVVTAAGWWAPARPRRRGNPQNPWVTLKKRLRSTGRRQRVFIDDDGRIERGLPEKYHGIYLSDLTEIGRQERAARKRARRQARTLFGRAQETFRSKDVAVKALLAANPHLQDFMQGEWGRAEEEYRRWRRRGRRGKKPQLALAHDGRLDAINYGFDLHGPRAVGSWLEALYETAPASMRWEEFAERLPALEEATGLRLELPAPAERLERRRAERQEFEEGTEQEVEDVYRRARHVATMQADGLPDDDELEAAPF